MKRDHELSVDYSKPKPCADFERVKWDICLVGKRREQMYRESETSWVSDEIIRSLRKRWRINVTTSSSICVHFYNAPFYFMMWLKWVLVSYNQKSQKRHWDDTYLLMKIEGPIGKMMVSWNFSSWVGCYSNWFHAIGRNQQAIVLKNGINFLHHVGPLLLSTVVLRCAYGLQKVPCPLSYILSQITISQGLTLEFFDDDLHWLFPSLCGWFTRPRMAASLAFGKFRPGVIPSNFWEA